MSPLSHLDRLEAEAISIIREVAAESRNPVMLYSIGKDSSVLLHLAMKAFHPGRMPFPLLHIDTTWKFRDMIAFRDRIAREYGLDLIVHTNPEGKAAGVGLLKKEDANIQQYVTGKSLDGLYLMIGEEEKKIRQNPVGTGSAILKKVFGALK